MYIYCKQAHMQLMHVQNRGSIHENFTSKDVFKLANENIGL